MLAALAGFSSRPGPPASADLLLLLLLLLLCSALPEQPSQQVASVTQVCSRDLLPGHKMSSNWLACSAWLPGRKTGRSRKGKPLRKMAVCFQLASRQGREGHVHQSIEDHRPMRGQVDAVSTNEKPCLCVKLLPSRTGSWVRAAGFIYQNKVRGWPRSRRRAG